MKNTFTSLGGKGRLGGELISNLKNKKRNEEEKGRIGKRKGPPKKDKVHEPQMLREDGTRRRKKTRPQGKKVPMDWQGTI